MPRMIRPLIVFVLLLAPSLTRAAPPAQSISYTSLLGARVNPLGLIEVFELSYRLRLYDSDSALFKNNFVSFGIRPAFTPAWGRASAIVRVQPLSILQLWAAYGGGGHFGTFGLMQSFPTADAEASDTVLDELEAAGTNYAASGTQTELGVLLQAKVGPIAARSSARFLRPDHNLRDGDNAFYDIVYDMVIPNRAWAVNKDTDVLWVSNFGFVAGVRWTFTHVFTRDRDFSTPGTDDPNSPIHRLGPLFAYSFFDDPGAAFNKPTILAVINWHLKHRYRTGQDVSQAVPYFVLGFRFSGDLWRSN